MDPRRRALLAALAATPALPVLAMEATAPAGSATSAAGGDPALHALNRIGWGPAPGDLDRVRRMGVEAWIDEQLSPDRLRDPEVLTRTLAALPTLSADPGQMMIRYRQLEQQGKQELNAAGGAAARAASEGAVRALRDDEKPMAFSPAARERRRLVASLRHQAATARLLRAIHSPRQLEEVMVDFWFNHFNVYDEKGLDHVLFPAYERDAIRPHVLGRFRDLLGATAHHAAMLFYLDNWLSVGPDFHPVAAPGKQPPTGLNENYARELMELHTLGVDGGYTQADVTQLARMLTGWTFGLRPRRDGASFAYDPARHDNGTKTWLGRSIGPAGQREGESALDILSTHPSTAKHIAYKLGQRFVADEPPAALVQAVAHTFQESGGDIRATLRTLFAHADFRAAASRPGQFKTPLEYAVSAVRATGLPATNMRPVLTALGRLGQPLYGCPTPDGWGHVQNAWLNPDQITRRVDFANLLASGKLRLMGPPGDGEPPGLVARDMSMNVGASGMQMGDLSDGAAPASGEPAEHGGQSAPVDPVALAATLGPGLSPKTRETVSHAAPALQAALMLGSPDFMRR